MAETVKPAPNEPVTDESKKPKRDFWDKTEILSRPILALITALVIAIIGFIGQQTLTTINNHEQNTRLITELLSKREQAESDLRKDMFNTILGGFFDKDNPEKQDLTKRILKLEMLALNFGDSLNLGPLFNEMSRDIDHDFRDIKKDPNWKISGARYQKRLRSVARRVASAQLATLSQRGISRTIYIPVDKMEVKKPDPQDWLYSWPDDLTAQELAGDTDKINIFKLDDKTYRVTMHFRNMKDSTKSIEAGLTIDSLDTLDFNASHTEMNFNLDYFNFPRIDNINLPNNQRIAMVLENFGQTKITVRIILFPGIYASQHDKPFMDDAVRLLNDKQWQKDSEKAN